jgi:hypothetical protein
VFKGGVDIFALVINYLDESWIPHHANVGLYKIQEIGGNTMTLQLQGLLEKFRLIHHVLAFMKVFVLGMSCLKLANTQPMMIRFYQD